MAAPIAAYLVRHMPARILGTAAGGLIVITNVKTVLESSLVDGRFWLPSRQEIEIRRSGTWMDFPVRGIIRGRWEICCHEANVGLDVAMFAGPEIVQAPQRVMQARRWGGAILDSLPPDVRAPTDPEVRIVGQLSRGRALWKIGGRTAVVHHLIAPREQELSCTRWRATWLRTGASAASSGW